MPNRCLSALANAFTFAFGRYAEVRTAEYMPFALLPASLANVLSAEVSSLPSTVNESPRLCISLTNAAWSCGVSQTSTQLAPLCLMLLISESREAVDPDDQSSEIESLSFSEEW